MKKTVYIETSIPSYLTARPSRDIRSAAWQLITARWWDEARLHYELFTSEFVLVEASAGDPEAAGRRLEALLLAYSVYSTVSAHSHVHPPALCRAES